MNSAKEKENKKLNDEILQLLSKPTAKVSAKGWGGVIDGAGYFAD